MNRSIIITLILLVPFLCMAEFGIQTLPEPTMERRKTEAELKSKAEPLVRLLGAADFKDRDRASADLIALAPGSLPYLQKHRNDPDPEISLRVRDILSKLYRVDPWGQTVAGLQLLATQVEPLPEPDQMPTFKLRLRNASRKDVYIPQSWGTCYVETISRADSTLRITSPSDNFVIMSGEKRPEVPVVVTRPSVHLIRLRPGEETARLMDISVDRKYYDKTNLEVRICLSEMDPRDESALGLPANTIMFPRCVSIKSGPVTVNNVAREEKGVGLESRMASFYDTSMKDWAFAQQEKMIRELTEQPDSGRAIARGLHFSIEQQCDSARTIFRIACLLCGPEHADAMLGFLERRQRNREDRTDVDLVHRYTRGFNEKDRRDFYARLAESVSYDWSFLEGIARPLSRDLVASERDIAARIYLSMYDNGYRDSQAMFFTVGRLLASKDDSLRNPHKALEVARAAIRDNPGNILNQYTLAVAQGDAKSAGDILNKVGGMVASNKELAVGLTDLAWDLVSSPQPAERNLELATNIAGIVAVQNICHNGEVCYETPAVALAAQGRYKEALEAILRCWWGTAWDSSEEAVAEHIPLFIGLANAEPGEVSGWFRDGMKFRGDKVRDALIDARTNGLKMRMRTVNDNAMLGRLNYYIDRVLRDSYGDDPKVKRLLSK